MIECSQWFAWSDTRSRSAATLHVEGRCHSSYASDDWNLREHQVPVPGDTSIRGPAHHSRDAASPAFEIVTPPGRYFVVELATGLHLFSPQRRGERAPETFYGSWSNSEPMTGSRYAVPDEVWALLRRAARLFYRVITTNTLEAWGDSMAWPTSWTDAPFVRIVDDPAVPNRTLPLVLTLRHGALAAAGARQPVTIRLARTGAEHYDEIAILTQDVVVPIDVVR